MKVLFIYPNIVNSARQQGLYHMGIGYLSSVLKRDGHEVSLLNIYKKIDKEMLIENVITQKPDLIAYSATSHMFPFVKQFCSWLLEEGLKFRCICGGVHATLAPQEVLETDGIDMVCIGEGELALTELCGRLERGKDISDIKNIWIKTIDGVKKNPIAPLLEELDDLPFPDRDIFNVNELIHESSGRLPMLASRGCPYNCSYCSNHALKSIYPNKGRFTRYRSVENVVYEIKEVLSRYPIFKSVLFHDDILFLNKIWSRNFINLYKQEVGIPFSCNIRPEIVDEEVASLLKEGGCFRICIGIESGNDHIRQQILRRRISTEQIRRALLLCKSKGIEVYTFNMVGIPFEKPRDILETIKLNSEMSSDSFQVSIFYPYKGTELYTISEGEGFLTDRRVDDYLTDSMLHLNTLSRSQVLMFRRYFVLFVRLYSVVYRLPKGYFNLIAAILDYFLTRPIVASFLNVIYTLMQIIYRRFLQIINFLSIQLREYI